MKKIIVLSSAIALSLAANVTVAQPGGWGNGQSAMNGDQAQMRPDRMQARIDRLMERFDVNQDEQITLDEVQSVRTAHFEQMDVDGNGLVNSDELETFRAHKREQYQNDATQNRRGKGQGKGQGGCIGNGMGNQLERLDNDGDGQISLSEFTANVPLFDRFDADENGIITQEELSQ
ncbi:MAG: EF-hand domain-containing protein [Thiomargarita sp.]|nr:EF-hand domain-containing protein [Thiomargarita sp.]